VKTDDIKVDFKPSEMHPGKIDIVMTVPFKSGDAIWSVTVGPKSAAEYHDHLVKAIKGICTNKTGYIRSYALAGIEELYKE